MMRDRPSSPPGYHRTESPWAGTLRGQKSPKGVRGRSPLIVTSPPPAPTGQKVMQSKGQFPRGTRGENPDAPWADEWPGECQLQDQGPCPPVRDLGETLLRSTSLVPKGGTWAETCWAFWPLRGSGSGELPAPAFASASPSSSRPLPIPKAPAFRPSMVTPLSGN